MGMYKEMVVTAKESGVATEKMMWKEIDNLDNLLEDIKDVHPKAYWKYIRKTHETMYGKHYDEEFAKYDVSQLEYTNRDGVRHTGAHWTPEEVLTATHAKQHPSGVTEWDKYVAYNAMYADLCIGFDDEQILKAAYLFFFNDEDWSKEGSGTKIWEYMCLHSKIK